MKPVRMWIGLVLVALGLAGVLDALDVLDAGDLLAWWPLAVVGLGVVTIIAQRHVSLGPVVVAAIGLVLLADTRDWASGGLWWPVVLVLVGGAILAGLLRHHTTDHQDAGETPVVLFGGTKVRNRSEHLTHAEVSAVFGGATLDLRGAHIDREATVDALALFGGVQVLVPEGWRVALGGLPVFGGYDDNTTQHTDPDAPLLRVNATALFGGVDVRNEPK
ncbi:LiaF transmembrane domain-containing protein [Saccharothrix variisporea]|uniref:Cell wall-active antibiotic response 4TMS protein YvqF n=2 Tax=Saccharothrix variisporea TaxID=543527 RepID=A0A495XK91_9PSEU|nr:cell wall-active antibiotic response 4TMS protein YvqF [Saccharothrix variisporea]